MSSSFQEKFKESKELLVHLRRRLKVTKDLALQEEILNLISILESPLFSRLVSLEDALSKLDIICRCKDLDNDHFDISSDTGELVFFARHNSMRRALSASYTDPMPRSVRFEFQKPPAGHGKYQTKHQQDAAGSNRIVTDKKDDSRFRKYGRPNKMTKRVEFGKDESLETIKDCAEKEEEADAPTTATNEQATLLHPNKDVVSLSIETEKISKLEKDLDQLIRHERNEDPGTRKAENGVAFEKIVLMKSHPSQDVGFGIAEVKNRCGKSIGFFVEGIQSEGLAAKHGGFQENDKIVGIDGQTVDQTTTYEEILKILNDPEKRGFEIEVARNKQTIFQPGFLFSSVPRAIPRQTSGSRTVEPPALLAPDQNQERNQIDGHPTLIEAISSLENKLVDQRDSQAAEKIKDSPIDSPLRSTGQQVGDRHRKEDPKGTDQQFRGSLELSGPHSGIPPNKHEISPGGRYLPTPVRVPLSKFPSNPSSTAQSAPSSPNDAQRTFVKGRSSDPADMVLNTEWTQLEVINLVNDGTGLGFGIIGGKSTGVVVKTIVSGSVSDRDGRLRSGDHILQICDVNVRGLGSEQVAAVLRQSGTHVRLLVARPVVDPSFTLKEGNEHEDGLNTPGSLFSPIVPTQQLNQHIDQLNALLSAYPEVVELGAEGLLVDYVNHLGVVIGNHVPDSSVNSFQVNHIGKALNEISPTISDQMDTNQLNHSSQPATTSANGGLGLKEGNLIHTVKDSTDKEVDVANMPDAATTTQWIESLGANKAYDNKEEVRVQILSKDRVKSDFYLDRNLTEPVGARSDHRMSLPIPTPQKRLSLATVVEMCSMESMHSPENKIPATTRVASSGDVTSPIKVDGVRIPKTSPLASSSSDFETKIFDSMEIKSVSNGNKESTATQDTDEMEYLEVDLIKGISGLGITVVGYSSDAPKDDICGIFVRSIAENSVAEQDRRLRANDQIIEVDNKPLKGLSNQQSVEVLKRTGQTVTLKVARYKRGKKYEQLQKCSKTIELMAHHNDEILIYKWKEILGDGFDVIVAHLMRLKQGGGLGMSLEGTVDMENGIELHPHHYIRSIYPKGPIAVNGRLKIGDELLEVNGIEFYGMDRMRVVSTLKDLPQNVCVVVARQRKCDISDEATPVNTSTSLDETPKASHQSNSGCWSSEDLLSNSLHSVPSSFKLKSKSEMFLVDFTSNDDVIKYPIISNSSSVHPSINGHGSTDHIPERSRSKSLEPISKFGVWSEHVLVVELVKSDRGLGFSILDYQDPLNPENSVIVIGSLVPGGAAHCSGKILPGDRLVFINDISLFKASLDDAVAALKGTQRGKVVLGILKTLPVCVKSKSVAEDNEAYSPETISLLERNLHKSSVSSPSSSFVSQSRIISEDKTDLDRGYGVPCENAETLRVHKAPAGSPPSSSVDNGLPVSRDASVAMIRSTTSSSSSENEYFIATSKSDPCKIPQNLQKTNVSKPDVLPKPKIQLKTSPVKVDPQRAQPQNFNQTSTSPSSTRVSPSSPASNFASKSSPVSSGQAPRGKCHLLPSVERQIVFNKGGLTLGLTLEIAPLLVKYGCVAKGISGAVERDGRMALGDLVTSINGESLQEVTNYQAKSILRRVALTGNDMSISYVPSKDLSQFISPSRECLHSAPQFRVK